MPTKHLCSICQFSGHNNHRAIFCNCCHHWTHLKCTHFSLSDYNDLTNSDEAWFCPPCLAIIFPLNHMEDDLDYYFSLYDFQTTSFDVEVLKAKCFNPFLDDSDSRHLLTNSDIDPDSNILGYNSHLLYNCLYLTSNEFNNITLSISDSFTLLHINLRSLKKHFEELSEFLSTLNMPFSVIGISETWLNNSNDDIFNIPGYKFISNNRRHKHGGGVGLFIKEDLNFLICNLLIKKYTNLYSLNSFNRMPRTFLLAASTSHLTPQYLILIVPLAMYYVPLVSKTKYHTSWEISTSTYSIVICIRPLMISSIF